MKVPPKPVYTCIIRAKTLARDTKAELPRDHEDPLVHHRKRRPRSCTWSSRELHATNVFTDSQVVQTL